MKDVLNDNLNNILSKLLLENRSPFYFILVEILREGIINSRLVIFSDIQAALQVMKFVFKALYNLLDNLKYTFNIFLTCNLYKTVQISKVS